ncbi:helix-turn-helix domain-containing protein [Lachnospiraceae bacterium HCP28S3_F9]
MTTSDMIRELCEKMNISISELARRIGQSPQNFNKKLQRGTVKAEEMVEIANVLGIVFEQRFVITERDIIQITNKDDVYNIGDYLWKK